MSRPDDVPGFWKIYPEVVAAMAGKFHDEPTKGINNGRYIASLALKLTVAALTAVEELKHDDSNHISCGTCKRSTPSKAPGVVLGRIETQPESVSEE